jgi:IclR family pca regulon transcriptional regulator
VTSFMKEVTQKVGKSCSAAVLDLPDVVYVARVRVQNVIALNLQIGSRLPAYVTSMGRTLLSSLTEDELDQYLAETELKAYTRHTETNRVRLKEVILQARADGYSMVDQEYENSLRSLAVPIHNSKGNVVCAMNIGFAAHADSTEEIYADYLPVLLETAKRIEQVLSHHH